MNRIHVFPEAGYAAGAARLLASFVSAAVVARGECHVALAGGSTPGPVYEALAEESVPWGAVHLYLGDERRVPVDDPASNALMVRTRLVSHLTISPAAFHPMPVSLPADAAAGVYEELLPATLDLCILGMGDDGHVASLFPNEPAVLERVRRVVPAESPSPPFSRLTITRPVIEGARDVVVLVTGAKKAKMVGRVLTGPVDVPGLPAQVARRGLWILDPAAARDIEVT
jgi:6-phosphogluconolactonase